MKWRGYYCLGLLGAACAGADALPPKAPAVEPEITADTLYETGKELFDALAPDEVKEQFEFPDRRQWDELVTHLQAALDGDSPAALAQYEPEVRAALAALRLVPGSEEYVGWLEERLDYIEAAKEMGRRPRPRPPAALVGQYIPELDLWLRRMQTRARPAGADKYAARLLPLFVAGGVPGPLVWLAEVESRFNPAARSPAGARGLFQLMPATARELGLRTLLPDERTDPVKSAQAAAQLLRTLHAKFADWPLALAAYNAGAGRVQRTLDQRRGRTFADIADDLPLETRLYVPKVLAVLQVRAGVALAGAPRR